MTDLSARLKEMWEDQRAFNLLLRQPPQSEEEMADQVRDFTIFTESELHELLRTLPWKKHRKVQHDLNHAQMHEEGIDAFKLMISILQIIGLDTWEEVIDAYWRKTAVVRQRYREEWTQKIDRDCVIIDIDNVLCDYVTGMINWLEFSGKLADTVVQRLRQERPFINAQSIGIPTELWHQWKHEFRLAGIKRTLPVFQDAFTFLFRMRADGYLIVLLTSRPIDRYPNIFTDTILWLNNNRLPYDFVWWAIDKSERLARAEGIRDHIRFAVDDDIQYVEQLASLGIETYWLQRDDPTPAVPGMLNRNVTIVHSLSDVGSYV